MITGAGRGLGLEFARQCLIRGDEVIACLRRPDAAPELRDLGRVGPGQLHRLPLDVTDVDSIEAAGAAIEATVGGVELLVNNAGMNAMSAGVPDERRNLRLGRLEPDGLLDLMRVNAIGPLLVLQRLAAALAAAPGSRVLNVSSWLGSIGDTNRGGNYGYAASKAALNMLTRRAALDLAGEGITVVAVNPGWVRTDMGGPGAQLDPAESVAGMLALAERLFPRDGGAFYDWNGDRRRW